MNKRRRGEWGKKKKKNLGTGARILAKVDTKGMMMSFFKFFLLWE